MSCAVLTAAGEFIWPVAAEAGVIVRQTDNVRVWQTVLDPSSPLSWPWHEMAAFASLSITNEVTGAVLDAVVMRSEGEPRGTYALSRPTDGLEGLFSVTLVQYAGEMKLSSDFARLAYTPGVGGSTVTVRSTRRSKWKKSGPVVPFAYDASWYGIAPGDVLSADVAWRTAEGSVGTNALSGASGWGTVALGSSRLVTLSLLFDDEVCATGEASSVTPGCMFIFK